MARTKKRVGNDELSNDVSLSWQTNKGFKKTVGRYISKDGQERPKTFWLGKEATTAKLLAQLILSEWKLIKQRGGQAWPTDILLQIESFKSNIDSPLQSGFSFFNTGSESKQTGTDTPYQPTSLLHELISKFQNQISQDSRKSQAYRRNLSHRCDALKQFIGSKPLSSIDADELNSLVNHYLDRPTNSKNRRQMSIRYAMDHIAAAKAFFEWLDASDYDWTTPRGFRRIFAIKQKTLKRMNPDCFQEHGMVQVFTIKELKALWEAALTLCPNNRRPALYFLLGLNAGMTQMELATLRLWQIKDINRPEARIERHRNKTGVFCIHHLWPETAEILAAEIATTLQTHEGYALLTKSHRPLVWFSDSHLRTDSVYQTFRRLCNRTNTRLSFKYLRKTAANLIRQRFDKDLASTYLSHADGIQSHYTNREWERLRHALDSIRQEIFQ